MVGVSTGTVVLMFHSIAPSAAEAEESPRGDAVYVLDRGSFEKKLDALAAMGLPVRTHMDPPEPGITVMITFDDGNASDASIALPLLESRSMKAAFFITTGAIGRAGRSSAEDINELHRKGMIIGSHGRTHRFLTGLPDGDLEEELAGSKAELEDITGSAIDSISAPGGRLDARVLEAASRAGYRFIYTSRPRVNAEVREGVPTGRFAVTDGWDGPTFSRVASGNPPVSMIVRHAILSGARKTLGDDLYVRLRGKLMGDR